MYDYRPLQVQAYEYLRKRILSEELDANQIYSESQIAAELQCSRTPVKDALTRLSHAKYVDIIPSKGFRIHKLTEDDLTNTFQTRVAIETYCALSIMQQKSLVEGKATLLRLHTLLEEQRRVVEQPDISAYLQADIGFHHTIMHFLSNSDFAELYELHAYRIEAPARHSLKELERRKEALAEHEAILRAIESGDVSQCYHSVLRHNESTFTYGVRALHEQSGSV